MCYYLFRINGRWYRMSILTIILISLVILAFIFAMIKINISYWKGLKNGEFNKEEDDEENRIW